ncbi:MFS general substrate transporter [Paxillus ammoniavirescens]|nr:MFS general substrate transporter [Paxillus ammoniavirescens]
MFGLSRVSVSFIDSVRPRRNSVDDMSAPSTSAATGAEVPDGGVEAWCALLGCFFAQFCGYGYMNAFGVYQAFYTQDYLANESPSTISWIGSIISFCATGVGLLCGTLFDRGYFYHVFIGGATLQSFSLFMLSMAKPGNYYQVLLAQGFGFGIGLGLMYVPTFAVLSHYFNRRRTTMMSIVTSGAALGGIVHTIMLNKLLNGSFGFQVGVRISAAFVTMLLFLSCLLVRPRYATVQKTTSVNFWKTTKKCFTEVPSLLTILGFTFFQTGFLYPFFYFQTDSLRHGLSASFSFYSLVIMNGGSFIGRFMVGPMTGFIGIIDLTIITTVICVILIISMIWLGTVTSVVVLGVLYGLFSGMNIAMMSPMLGLTADPAELGVRMGVGFVVIGTTNFPGSPISGALLTSRYIWWAPALFSGVCPLRSHILFDA